MSFACPICHGPLANLTCSACGIDFPLNHGVPSFVCRAMYESDDAYASALKVIEFWGHGWEKRLAEPEHAFLFSSTADQLKQWAAGDLQFQKDVDALMGNDLPMESLKGKTVLNIGTGAGTEALLLTLAGAHCVAMDLTAQAAKAAEQLIRTAGMSGVGIQADARYIPMPDDSVDVVYSSGVLHHSAELERSIAEIRRVLKPGGMAYVMLYATWSIIFVQMRVHGTTGETAWETGRRKNPHTTTYTKAECRRLFSEYEDVTVRKVGGSLTHLHRIGRFMPTFLDPLIHSALGPRLQIVATKPVTRP